MLTVARPHMKAVLTAVFPLEKAGPIAVRLRKGVSQIAVRPSKADAQADSRRDLGGSRTQGRQRNGSNPIGDPRIDLTLINVLRGQVASTSHETRRKAGQSSVSPVLAGRYPPGRLRVFRPRIMAGPLAAKQAGGLPGTANLDLAIPEPKA
jgi:hypothetical protein